MPCDILDTFRGYQTNEDQELRCRLIRRDVGMLATEDGEDSTAGPSQRMYFAKSTA